MSCWAFAVAQMIETTASLAAKQDVVPLSAQFIVDCIGVSQCEVVDPNEHLQGGCNGGWMQDAIFDMVKENKNGVPTEADYPYELQDKCANTRLPCRTDVPSSKTVTGSTSVAASDDAIETALVSGPVGVAIYADCPDFGHYAGGLYDASACTIPANAGVDHAVILVGYTNDHFILKNQWSENWGEKGYMQIKRKPGDPKGTILVHLAAYTVSVST